MDVTCERCSTEYEFDDALVSERGTTVKCTNCGHQFKVRRADAGAVPERWVVRTVDGRELEFTALRDLQSAISYTRVTRDDVISRGGARPRRLGSIAELEPFFTMGIAAPAMTTPGLGVHSAQMRSRTPTPVGLGVMSPAPGARTEGSVAIPLPTGPRGESAVARRPAPTLDDEATMSLEGSAGFFGESPRKAPEAPPRPATAARPPSMPPVPYPGVVVSPENAPPVPVAPRVPSFDMAVTRVAPAAAAEEARRSPTTTPGMPAMIPSAPSHATSIAEAQSPPSEPHGPDSSNRQTMPVGIAGSSVVLLPPEPTSDKGARTAPDSSEVPSADPPAIGRRRSVPPMTPTPAPVRSSRTDEIYMDPRFSGAPSKRSGGARLIVGLVVAGLVVFTGMTVGRKYLAGRPSQGSGPVADERISELLREGEKSLAEGDLETAKEQLDKASERDPRDVRVAAALARLSTARADQRWLKLRLMTPDDPDRESTKRELDTLAERAKKAADSAAALAPQDPTMIRYQVDALRLLGDGEGARKLTKSMAGTSAQPEAALVLAGLDLAEDKPDWPTVLDRLRTAATGEQNLGRARSMLVYALARAGDFAGAKTELERLVALPRPHPLTPALRLFLARSEKDGKGTEAAGGEVPEDLREAIRLGNEARTKGDLARAERLFKDALQKNPGNKEAQTGLGDVARARKEPAEAIRLYQQALNGNPDHVPAIAGLADLKWEIGDRKGAVAAYKRLLQRDPNGPHAERAKDRIKQGASAGGSGERPDDGRVPDDYVHPGTVDTSDMPGTKPPTPTATPSAPTTAPPTTAPPTATPAPSPTTPPASPPAVDTSDLPGVKPQ